MCISGLKIKLLNNYVDFTCPMTASRLLDLISKRYKHLLSTQLALCGAHKEDTMSSDVNNLLTETHNRGHPELSTFVPDKKQIHTKQIRTNTHALKAGATITDTSLLIVRSELFLAYGYTYTRDTCSAFIQNKRHFMLEYGKFC